MIRTIIKIDDDLCDGCGVCVSACHEGAIVIEQGKARLIRDDYCDGLGNCLPACPTGAITFEEREAAAFDEAAVEAHLASQSALQPAPMPAAEPSSCGCPGSAARTFTRPAAGVAPMTAPTAAPVSAPVSAPVVAGAPSADPIGSNPSELRHWPVQVQLVSPSAGFLAGADVLLAADCAAYACGDFHRRFMAGKAVLIGCPKLDRPEWVEKFAYIVATSEIASLTVVRMQVPCCGGIVGAAEQAIARSGKQLALRIFTLSAEGDVISEEVR